VPGPFEDQVLVHLVRHGHDVAAPAEVRDDGKLFLREDLAGRIVGGVEDEQPRAGREEPLQLRGVQAEVRETERAEPGPGAGEPF